MKYKNRLIEYEDNDIFDLWLRRSLKYRKLLLKNRFIWTFNKIFKIKSSINGLTKKSILWSSFEIYWSKDLSFLSYWFLSNQRSIKNFYDCLYVRLPETLNRHNARNYRNTPDESSAYPKIICFHGQLDLYQKIKNNPKRKKHHLIVFSISNALYSLYNRQKKNRPHHRLTIHSPMMISWRATNFQKQLTVVADDVPLSLFCFWRENFRATTVPMRCQSDKTTIMRRQSVRVRRRIVQNEREERPAKKPSVGKKEVCAVGSRRAASRRRHSLWFVG